MGGRLALAAVLCGGLLAWGPGSALAQPGSEPSGLYVTFAARWCPNYSDVYPDFNNSSNVVEHLEPVGPVSQYVGVPDEERIVSPKWEDYGTQRLVSQGGVCHPLPGWKFTLGLGKVPKAVRGAWGALSVVTGYPVLPHWQPPEGFDCPPTGSLRPGLAPECQPPFDPTDPAMAWSQTPFPEPIVTQAETTLYNQDHQAVGTLPGAATIELSNEQAAAAKDTNIGCGGYNYYEEPQEVCEGGLWAQGGTPTDPVLASQFGTPTRPEYGFAALRCAYDNALADNAEIISFRNSDTHVFCFAYYVKPAPEAGTIIIKKAVEGDTNGENPSFHFDGTVSFGTQGFDLANGDSFTFRRAGGRTWTAIEKPVDDFHLASITCNAVTGTGVPGQSTASTSVSTATAAIHLVAGETVTCTFTNRAGPAPPGLTIAKVTNGGVGTFDYRVTPTAGGTAHRASARTFEPGILSDATPSPLPGLAPGSYRIREVARPTPGGSWRLQSVECNGVRKPTRGPVAVDVTEQGPTVCVFTNAFVPRGSISIAKITRGGTGTTQFMVKTVRPDGGPRPGTLQGEYRLSATTKREGVAAAATPPITNHLRLGQYQIIEQAPAGTPVGGWTLESVECNGIQVPFADGATVVTLTRSQPDLHCVFTNTFTRHPPPPPPPGPDPLQNADLSVTKHASPAVATTGEVVTFRITVTNHGPDHASRVMLHDQLFGSARLVSIHTDAGRCSARLPVVCDLGTLKPGVRASITVRLRITGRSRFRDRAVVGAATNDPNLANNVASATVRLSRPSAPPFTG